MSIISQLVEGHKMVLYALEIDYEIYARAAVASLRKTYSASQFAYYPSLIVSNLLV